MDFVDQGSVFRSPQTVDKVGAGDFLQHHFSLKMAFLLITAKYYG